MFKFLKKKLCHHDWRYSAYESTRCKYGYVCTKCGERMLSDHSLDCSGCQSLYFNSCGGAECMRPDNGKSCLNSNRQFYERSRVEN